MLPKVISFHELYPFDFETTVNPVDVESQQTSDENAKSPDEDQVVVSPQASGTSSFTKNKMFIFLAIIIAIIVITHFG